MNQLIKFHVVKHANIRLHPVLPDVKDVQIEVTEQEERLVPADTFKLVAQIVQHAGG